VGFVGIILIVAAVAGGVFYLQYRNRQARIRGVAALAQSLGFSFSIDDTERLVDLPFGLFNRGDGRKVELVCAGKHDDLPLRLFDYWYYDETSDTHGNRSRSYHRFTCALASIPAACPLLRLGHEGFFSKLGSKFGMHDVELEYDDFNQRFRVRCDDQKFAFSLLDGRMMEWLLKADGFESIEVGGPWILLAVGKLAPAEWGSLVQWIEQFHSHIPPVVFTTYPAR
jgi:hypothetical protein